MEQGPPVDGENREIDETDALDETGHGDLPRETEEDRGARRRRWLARSERAGGVAAGRREPAYCFSSTMIS